MDTTLPRSRPTRSDTRTHATDDEARIGPNAVTRTIEAVTERLGPEMAKSLREAAAVPSAVPAAMVPERWFVRLVAELRSSTPEPASRAILRAAGAATAGYVTRHRIPRPARLLLRLLPEPLALRVLLGAVERHAWTFAGRGDFRHAGGVLTLSDSPTCRRASDPRASSLSGVAGAESIHAPSRSFGGAYYEAAFEGILSLAARDVVVREVACIRTGAPACRFRIERAGQAAALARASSTTADVSPVFARSH